MGMCEPSIAPTHCGSPSPALNVGSHLLESSLVRNPYLLWHQKRFRCSTKLLHTVVQLTLKRWAMVWYSEPVASFQRAIATRFFKGTQWRKLVSCFFIAGCILLQMKVNVSSDILKFSSRWVGEKLGTMGLPPLRHSIETPG